MVYAARRVKMILKLHQVLNAQQIQAIEQCLSMGRFEDGKATAGWAAKRVKNNQQWCADEALMDEVNNQLVHALARHPDFACATYAKDLAPFLLSESRHGGGYGEHVDDALMGEAHITRTDISCTIFLSAPEDYEGGELQMQLMGQAFSYKLNAGDAIIYPSTTLHQVAPVTNGCRRVAVTWIESHVRDAAKREVLYDLDVARKQIMQSEGKSATFDRVHKSHANLLRQWAET